MKVGRNDPCPCGSNKKYKKCCLEKDEERKLAERDEPSFVHSAKNHSGLGFRAIAEEPFLNSMMTPYALARMLEKPPTDAPKNSNQWRAFERHRKNQWTIAKIAEMSTEDILGQLAQYGVSISKEAFLDEAAERYSAWGISAEWSASEALRCKGNEEDFLGLAACELWKRWLPESPSTEMTDDWMQEGYELLEQDLEADAALKWWEVWQILRDLFSPNMTTMNDTEAVFMGTQCLWNWSHDFETCLRNASLKDERYVEMGRNYCEEMLRQFSEEIESFQVIFRNALAYFLFREGDIRQGLELLDDIVEQWPDNVWGYIYQADALGNLFGNENVPLDIAEAKRWIHRGFEKAHDAGEREFLTDRLQMLEEQAAKLEG